MENGTDSKNATDFELFPLCFWLLDFYGFKKETKSL